MRLRIVVSKIKEVMKKIGGAAIYCRLEMVIHEGERWLRLRFKCSFPG